MSSKGTNKELNYDPGAKNCLPQCLFSGLSAGHFVYTEWSQCTVVLTCALLQ